MVVGLLLASLAAVAFGSGTFIQHMTAVTLEPPDHHRTRRGLLRLLASLATRPRWLFGQALAGGGTALQFTALAFAPVAVVEPIVGAGLPVALVLEAVRMRRRPRWRLLTGLVLCVAGLVVFLLFSRASSPRRDPGLLSATLLLALGAGLAMVSRFAPGGRVGSVLSGLAAGGCLGVAVVAVAVPIARFQARGLGTALAHWGPYLAGVVGLLATAATQQAYVRGELAWSLPALTVADPLVATTLSVFVLHEQLDQHAAPIWSAGALAAAVGVALSAMSRPAGMVTTAPTTPSSLTQTTAGRPHAGGRRRDHDRRRNGGHPA